jgi:tetratricopeptide (TPR) repeat protein
MSVDYLKILIISFITGLSIASFAKDIGSDIDESDLQQAIREFSNDEKKDAAMKHFIKAYSVLQKENNITDAVFTEFLEAVKNDPDSKYCLNFMLQSWSALGKKQADTEKILLIAEKEPSALLLNLEVSKIMYSSDEEKRAASLLEGSIKKLEDFPDKRSIYIKTNYKRGYSGIYQEAVILLGELYTELEEFEKGDDLYEDTFEMEELVGSFELKRSAVCFYSQIADRGEDGFFSGWSKRRYRRRLEEHLSCFEELAGKRKYDVRQFIPVLRVYNRYQMFDRAEKLLMKNLLFNPDDTPTILFLAAVYYDSENYSLAVSVWEKMLKKDPSNPRYHFELARAAFANKDYDTAEQTFKDYLRFNSDDPAAFYYLGMACHRQDKYNEAIKYLDKVKNMPSAYYMKAMSYSKLDKWEKALASMLEAEKTAINLKDTDFLSKEFYFSLCFFLEKRNDLKKSLRILDNLYKKYPEDPEICNYFGYTLADNNLELDKAEKLIEKALDGDEENSAYLDSMAWVYFRKKEFRKALKYIEKSLYYEGDLPNAVIVDHAGDIYHALGMNEKAVESWKAALERNSKEIEPEKIRGKIENLESGKR